MNPTPSRHLANFSIYQTNLFGNMTFLLYLKPMYFKLGVSFYKHAHKQNPLLCAVEFKC